jgi:hypothetical protein
MRNGVFSALREEVLQAKVNNVNWATLFLGNINMGTWTLQVGVISVETVKYGYGF